MATETRWDQSVFDKTLAEYLKVSTRTLAEIVNNKGYYIARKALWFTPKASAASIKSDLGQVRTRTRTIKAAGHSQRVKETGLLLSEFAKGQKNVNAPMAVLLVQSKAKKAGRRSPWFGKVRAAGAAAMTSAIQNLIVARKRSISFLKSGWLPSIQLFGAQVRDRFGLPPIDARRYGRPKGRGELAQPGFIVRASIENFARTIKDYRFSALNRYGAPALQKAFDDETQSMREYMETKLDPDAAIFNQAQHRNN